MDTKKLIESLLKTSSGKSALAKALTTPIMHRMDFAGLARKIFASECCVCHKIKEEHYTHFEDFSVGDESTGEGNYVVCQECRADTSEELFEISKKALIELPLLINSPNPFIAYAAKERLKNG